MRTSGGSLNGVRGQLDYLQGLGIGAIWLKSLRYGRQYFRPVSGNGTDFGITQVPAGILTFSPILNDVELVLAAKHQCR